MARIQDPFPVHLTAAQRAALLNPSSDPAAHADALAAIRHADRIITGTEPLIEPGQTWADTKAGRQNGQWKQLMSVERVSTGPDGALYAHVRRLHNNRASRIRADRFHPDIYGVCAYTFVSDPPD